MQLSANEIALRDAARAYHRQGSAGKIAVAPTKPLDNQRDLSLAYSPGVAYPCLDIQADATLAAEYTARANLVGVITNGTAVLGLGDIGPLAAKPVMEGKGCLFKKFAGIDVFDIELAEKDVDQLVNIIAALEPTFGGINLEDIKAPECFAIERKLRERLSIPVFHDDQHGTAIISAAALLNALELVGKKIGEVKVAVSGAGAAAIACLDLMVELGVQRANIFACDSKGLIYSGRPGGLDASKARYAQDTPLRTLADAVAGADVFLGCSTPGVLDAEMLRTMAARPVILALANPEPRDPPRSGKGRPGRLHHRHRPLGLPEPGQQRAVLPLHLPRRAGLRRHEDHRSHEAGLRAGDRGACQGRGVPGSRRCLSRPATRVRGGLPDPRAVRSPPAHAHRAGRGARRGRIGRGDAPCGRLRGVRAAPRAHRPPGGAGRVRAGGLRPGAVRRWNGCFHTA
jgi:hypothetical protein